MSAYGQVFTTILNTYDLALVRSGRGVQPQQRILDVLNIVTEYHREQQERLARQRERKEKAANRKRAEV